MEVKRLLALSIGAGITADIIATHLADGSGTSDHAKVRSKVCLT